MKKNTGNFLIRFYQYQRERFPVLTHGPLIAAFSFSAISYSRICRGESNFIPAGLFLVCIFNTITLFLLLRIFDEFKDKADDARYRPYLPVPRGLISLDELRITGIVIFILQLAINLLFVPSLITLYFIVIAFLLLMGREFFVAEWLRKRQMWYNISHMFIIPLIDIYASAYDWKLAMVKPPAGLFFFFIVSYCNGMVLETGRKIKSPDLEEESVVSYSKLYGTRGSVFIWLLWLTVTLISALFASAYAAHPAGYFISLVVLFFLGMIPAFLFLRNSGKKTSKAIEIVSGMWTIGMYLVLGGIPMLL